MSQNTPPAAEPVRLGALEAQVMEVLWDRGGATVRQIMEALPSDPAYTTIATVLGNLERKGLEHSHRQGRRVKHLPRVSREEYAASQMGHALQASGDRAASILHFVETISDQDRDLLRQYLQQQDGAGQSHPAEPAAPDTPSGTP